MSDSRDFAASWMVVDSQRNPVVTNIASLLDAQVQADEWNNLGLRPPYRVVEDIVGESA